MSVPKAMQSTFDEIADIIRKFCNDNMDDEYLNICLRLLEKLCRKRPSPLLSGRANSWAAAIVYAVGQVNFIFDPSQNIHMTADELTEPFGLKKGTVSSKAAQIRKMCKMGYFAPESTLPSIMAKHSPFIIAW